MMLFFKTLKFKFQSIDEMTISNAIRNLLVGIGHLHIRMRTTCIYTYPVSIVRFERREKILAKFIWFMQIQNVPNY